VIGVQAGCDYQFAGGFVIGIQGDYALGASPPATKSRRQRSLAVSCSSSAASSLDKQPRLGINESAWGRRASGKVLFIDLKHTDATAHEVPTQCHLH
jgi:hypothetical protein